MSDVAQRFWSKANKGGGCWLWEARVTRDGYGKFTVGSSKDGTKATVYAHRYAYELANGPIPKGLHVCHSCDVPACVNPAHLWLGTNADNVADKVAKGRHHNCAGEHNGNAKLSDAQVTAIRAMRMSGTRRRELAERFGCAPGYVSKLVRGTFRGAVR